MKLDELLDLVREIAGPSAKVTLSVTADVLVVQFADHWVELDLEPLSGLAEQPARELLQLELAHKRKELM